MHVLQLGKLSDGAILVGFEDKVVNACRKICNINAIGTIAYVDAAYHCSLCIKDAGSSGS